METEGIAIPLILHQEREGFKINPEGLAFLNSIDKRIGVISVVGKYRTGKSYLLNKIILGLKGQGFGVGPSINPCTKGIWIYNKTIDIKTADGEDISLLILDSEGLGAFDEDSNHDTKIFILAVLLSSFFIYNSVGSIDENALNNISLIVSLTKQLQIRASDSELDVDEAANYFPTFLWVLRDFSLQLIDSTGNPITSKEYLENSLMPQKGMSDAIEAKNRIRKLLKHFFKDRDCFALVRPSEDERTLQNLQNVRESDLRPEFLRQTEQLKRNILRKVKPKCLNGKPLNGKMLASIAQSYVDAINKGAVPTIEGAWQSVVTSECNKQIDLLTAEYDKKIKSKIGKEPLSQEELKQMHKEFKAEAEKVFKDKAVGDDTASFLELLKKRVTERYEMARSHNERKLMEKCQEKCEEVSIDMQDKLKLGEYTDFQVFKRDFEKKVVDLRKNMPVGDATETKIKELSSTLLTEAAEYINRSQIMEHQNANRRLAQQLEFLKSTMEGKRDEFIKEKDYYKNRLQDVESENYKLKASTAGLEIRIEELKQEKERISSTHQEKLDSLKDDYKGRFSEYKEKYEQTLKLYQDLQAQYNIEISKLQKDLALAKQEIEWKNREVSDLKARRDSIENEFRDMRGELRRCRDEIEEKDEQIKLLKNNARYIAAEPSTEWLSEKSILINQIESYRAQIEDNKSVKEALVAALQARSLEPVIEPKDPSKHLTVVLEKTEERCQELEHKLERLKKFQKIFQCSSSIQCKMCAKYFTSNLFQAHIQICEEYFARISETGEYIIAVTQIKMRDNNSVQNPGNEYVISVTYKGRTWSITKLFKNFKTLETILQKDLPNVELPDANALYPKEAGSIFSNKQPTVEERKKRFQDYLSKLASIPEVKTSAAFRKFLNKDQFFPEENIERSGIRNPSDPKSFRFNKNFIGED